MTLKIYDTAQGQVREFVPLKPNTVGMYVCGATVQDEPHIGHMRSAVAFDVIYRWFLRLGYDVTYIRNVTDIDDKILKKSKENNSPWWAWAYLHEQNFYQAYAQLGNLPPTYEPRATGHMQEMVDLMKLLVEREHAYTTPSGDVYFDVQSWEKYGSLTRQNIADVISHEEQGNPEKKNPVDFALWKTIKGPEQGPSWPTPYGPGRPGWHLECSAMARKYLGQSFDIHGGGLDLRFPHHENEQAQAQAAGWDFANYWVHSAWVTQGGEKMSKSLGNGLRVSEVLQQIPAVILRFALATVHYRSMLEWTAATVQEAQSTWEKIVNFATKVTRMTPAPAVASEKELSDLALPEAFTAAMNDDFNVAKAFVVIHERIKYGNVALGNNDAVAANVALNELRAMLDVFGLDPLHWFPAGEQPSGLQALEILIEQKLQERQDARQARDFALADKIRDELVSAGVVLEDSANGTTWSVKN